MEIKRFDSATELHMIEDVQRIREEAGLTKKHILIPLNVQNKNGRIYTENSFDQLKDEYMVELADALTDVIDIGNVKAVVRNISFEKDAMVGELSMLDVPLADIVKSLLDDDAMVIRPKAIANCINGLVKNAELVCFQFIRKASDSFS